MERNIYSFLLIHLLFSVIPALQYAEASSVIISKVVHVRFLKTWLSARYYCRHYYTDLVTIRNTREAVKLAPYEGWIGLYRQASDGVWKWSRGDENASNVIWDYDEPDSGEDCVLKYMSYETLESDNCSHLHYALCTDDRLILVQEMKTWEEAFQHCEKLQYKLASFSDANNAVLDRETIGQSATTDEVWVGMRFLAGEWFWMGGQAVSSSYLPHCPAHQQHCAALVHNNTQWKIMDCAEKRNFLCYQNSGYWG